MTILWQASPFPKVALKPILAGQFYNSSPGSGGSPGGADGDIQYNNAGAFGGVTGLTTLAGVLQAGTFVGQVIGGNNAGALRTTGVSVWSGGILGFTSGNADGTFDTVAVRKAPAVWQFGLDAAGVTNQMLTAANRTGSDGVGANLTIAPGNGLGGAGGSLILSTFTTAGAGVAGTLTPRLTIDTAGLITALGQLKIFGAVANANKVIEIENGAAGGGTMFFGVGSTGSPADVASAGFLTTDIANGLVLRADAVTGRIRFVVGGATAGDERMRIFSSGGVSIGNTTDPGSGVLSVIGGVKFGDATAGPTASASGTSPNESFVISPSGTGLFRVNTAAAADAAAVSTHSVMMNFNGTDFLVLLRTPP